MGLSISAGCWRKICRTEKMALEGVQEKVLIKSYLMRADVYDKLPRIQILTDIKRMTRGREHTNAYLWRNKKLDTLWKALRKHLRSIWSWKKIFRKNVPEPYPFKESRSWDNSLQDICTLCDDMDIPRDAGIIHRSRRPARTAMRVDFIINRTWCFQEKPNMMYYWTSTDRINWKLVSDKDGRFKTVLNRMKRCLILLSGSDTNASCSLDS